MTEHKHEPLVGTDSLIRCKACGQILDKVELTISHVSSAYRARKVLENIASAGKYTIIGFHEDFPVYSKNKNGIIEEITASKITIRDYRIIKRLISEGAE